MAHVIRAGPAGWSYADWRGIVYPKDAGSKFDQLAYIASYFDVIEINSSFYRPPSEKTSRSWARRVAHNDRFKFTAKLYQRFTHERDQATPDDERDYRLGIDPLVEAGKLGAILIQFPWSFKNTRENREYLDSLIGRFGQYPLVVEVRHSSWNAPEIYQSLQERDVGFCNIDQPLFSRSIKPSALTTSAVGYVRLHGRNYEHWFADFSDDSRARAERYNYLYSTEELKPWVDKIKKVASQSVETFVITNNHFQGKGVVNALEIEHELTGKMVPGPPSLFDRYPRIKDSVIPGDFFRIRN
jgi:uncharacterized protein YecE (DUF72 family)